MKRLRIFPLWILTCVFCAQACQTGTLEEILRFSIDLAPLSIDCSGEDALITASWFDSSDSDFAMYRITWREQGQNWSDAQAMPWDSARSGSFSEDKGTLIDVRIESVDDQRVSNVRSVQACQVGSTNQAPSAEAGPAQSIQLPTNSVTLDGSASSDSDGTLANWLWSQVSGPTVAVIESATMAQTQLNALYEGQYVFLLTVTDDDGATATDTVTITVNPAASGNMLPVADAGGDVSGASGIVVYFDGGSSHDPDGSIASWHWDFGDGTSADVDVVSHFYGSPGTYTATLTVTDNEGGSDTDSMIVQVNSTVVVGLNPQAIAGCASGNPVFSLSWTADPLGRHLYRIDRRLSGTTTYTFITWDQGTTYTDTATAAGQTVQYRIQAWAEPYGYTSFEFTATLTPANCGS